MLQVRTILGISGIHGIGLFAVHNIPRGELVWKFDEGFDIKISRPAALPALPQFSRDFINHHGYINPEDEAVIVLCADNARFLNFSNTPNLAMARVIDFGEKRLIAAREILQGEEITVGPETDADYSRKMNLTL